MSKIFFISYNVCDHPYEVYPLGMAVVAAYARQQGHEIKLYDYLAAGKNDQKLLEAVKNYDPDFVAISIRNLDDEIDSDYREDHVKKFSAVGAHIKQLRTITAAVFIIGGAAVSLTPDIFLDITTADYAIVGEGEKALCRLIANLHQGKPVERIIRGADYSLFGTDIKGAFYDSELVSWYYQRSGLISLQTKRGCPFQCVYCTYPGLEGNQFRYRHTDEVAEEILRLKSDFGYNNFFFTDSVFNDPCRRYLELAEAIIIKNCNIQWVAYFTPYGLQPSDIELCKRSGLYAVELGTDASNTTALAGLKKMYDWEDVLKANKIITGAGLPCAHFVIFGGPDETYQTIAEGIHNCMQLEKSVVFGYTGIRVYPGSPLYARAIAEKVIEPESSLFESAYYFSPEVKKEKVDEQIVRGWRKNKRMIFPLEKARMISRSLKMMYHAKGLIWDQMCKI